MKARLRYSLLSLAVLVAVALGCGAFMFHFACDPQTHAAVRDGDVMRWMRCEFHLTDAQYAEIVRLHEEQSARCAVHCAAVQTARAGIEAALSAGDHEGIEAARKAVGAAEAVCMNSTEAHVRRVAAVMAPEEGRRYLEMVLPRVAGIDHEAPPGPLLEH